MVYKLGRRKIVTFRTKLFWGLVLTGTLVLGCVGTAVAMGHMDKPLSFVGLGKGSETNQPNSGRRSPTVLANGTTSNKPGSKPKNSAAQTSAQAAGLRALDCNSGTPRTGLAASAVPQLLKLAEYEQICPRAVEKASFFIGTPASAADADGHADWVASVLKNFSAHQVSPLVFMEPATSNGLIDAKQYRNGAYDAALDAFFAALKAKGVTDAMMGTWVPWPEANIPVWTSVDPGDFVANVTKAVQFQKKHFPTSKAAVLLESKTYPNAGSWSGGAYVSLLPYVQSIPKGLIDSFGLQGFAWPPTSPGEAAMLEPATFLRIDLAAQAAASLGTKEIWFNTGAFYRSYVVSKTDPFVLGPEQRQAVLDGIVRQAKTLKGQGYNPKVHIFAQDKSALGEAIDWSFWHELAPTSDATKVFKTFVRDLQNNAIDLWLYDATVQ